MTFKKLLTTLTEDELREELQALHKRFPQVREYYTVELSDDPRKVLDNYKQKLRKTFFPSRGRGKRGRSQSRQIIKAFRAVNDRVPDLNELLFYRAELMADYVTSHRLDSDAWAKSVHAAFTDACALAREEMLLDVYRDGARALADKYTHHRRARSLRLRPIFEEYFGA